MEDDAVLFSYAKRAIFFAGRRSLQEAWSVRVY